MGCRGTRPSGSMCCDRQGEEGPGLSRPSILPELGDGQGGQGACLQPTGGLSGCAGNEPKGLKSCWKNHDFHSSQLKGLDTPGVLGSSGGIGAGRGAPIIQEGQRGLAGAEMPTHTPLLKGIPA